MFPALRSFQQKRRLAMLWTNGAPRALAFGKIIGDDMRVRAIKDLSQLDDSAFFTEAGEGLGLVIANARRLYNSAIMLAKEKHYHGARVLEALSEEEASKYLILVDAVRCPRKPGDYFAAQLGRFNDHLAKGLYSRACLMRPATLNQLQEYLDHYREEFYLDGPNDVDWVFRNDILRSREEALYVDYVAHDDGHTWFHPGIYSDSSRGCFIPAEPGSLLIAGLLDEVGMSTAEALATVADLWRHEAMLPEMQWTQLRQLNHATLEQLDSKGLLQERSNSDYQQLIDRWQFPLYTLDLNLIRVDIESLREKQSLWIPDWS